MCYNIIYVYFSFNFFISTNLIAASSTYITYYILLSYTLYYIRTFVNYYFLYAFCVCSTFLPIFFFTTQSLYKRI